ncbi:Na+/H+ antiporter subunit D [Streptomyces sp. N2-109]|uniref:Na+/H+ antiporter subunit D n=1 Tax=Streptomyces gossypii TaxID=2883101 RepID=A0ABT2JSX4_9ACTN|nr:Na+/H+ antiporter subunit D [Streptomyces gossypii]MCT2590975.1 Na+/H+ antiporter subunit D [Streptomyces gossypii]
MTTVLALPVLLPVLAAGASLALRHHHTTQRLLSVGVLATVLATAITLLVRADQRGPQVLPVGGWDAPTGVSLVADRLSALLLTVSILVALSVLVFAIGQGVTEPGNETAATFHPAYLLLTGGVGLAFLSGDLFNLFVAFEVMLGASYVLITLDSGRARARAGMTYTMTSLTSSLLFITAVALCYGATGTVNLAQLAGRVAELPEGLRSALSLLLLVVFGIKSAMVPLHFWLPDSYPTAPSPITAVFAALLTKVGVYGMLRTQTLLFPRDDTWILLAVLAIATLLIGVLGAIAQDDVNRLLSFTLVSHIGFMLLGLALFDVAGLTGAILYVVHHIVVQATLFLAAALVVHRTGTAALHRMKGRAPPTALITLLFLVPAMSLAGIPPFSGFIAKLALFQAAVAEGSGTAFALLGAAVLTSFLTLAAMARLGRKAFLETVPGPSPASSAHPAPPASPASPPAPPDDEAHQEVPARLPGRLMLGATCAMALTGITLAVCAGPLARLSERAADDLLRRDTYRTAVLEEEGR